MALLTQDFLESRRKTRKSRYQGLILPIGVFLLGVGAITAGLYLAYREPPVQQVAGATERKLPAEWLMKYFGTDNEQDPKVGGAKGDPDHDILSNQNEYYFGTDPTKADTDGDGAMDGAELAFGLNPNGPGKLKASRKADEYLKSLGPEYEAFSRENIQKKVEAFFKPQKAVVMELPLDSELRIVSQNDKAAFEKYYEETKALASAEEGDAAKIQTSLMSMSDEEFEIYIAKLEAQIKLLKDVSVPSELLNIHKFKIAALTAGVRMFELVKNTYNPGVPNQQFWQDFFYQTMVARQATGMELAAWAGIGKKLKDQGGL